jgi:quinol monooxygenase YgiN
MTSELCIFARFHAKPEPQDEVAATINEVLTPTRQEPGCLSINAFSATQDPRLFPVWPGRSHVRVFTRPRRTRGATPVRLPDCRPLRPPVAICARFTDYIHSRCNDEAAFDRHAQLPHTVQFLEMVQPLIDHPLEVTRTWPLA